MRGLLMGFGYLLLEGRDPLLRPSTLEEHLELVGGRARVWLDLKTKGVERGAAALARAYGARPVVSSGFHNTLRLAREGCGAHARERDLQAGGPHQGGGTRVGGRPLDKGFVEEELVEELHSVGYKVAVRTVNDPPESPRAGGARGGLPNHRPPRGSEEARRAPLSGLTLAALL